MWLKPRVGVDGSPDELVMGGRVEGTEPARLWEDSYMGAMDKAKDKGQEVKGAVKEKVGQSTGDAEMETEGKKDKAVGAIKGAGEKAKDAFK